MTKPKTLADLLKTEARCLERETVYGFVYSSFPYPCGMTEALGHAKRHTYPSNRQLTITREPRMTRIEIKPLKGTGRRKPLVIRLWT